MYKKVLILLFFIPFQLLFAQTSMLKDFRALLRRK